MRAHLQSAPTTLIVGVGNLGGVLARHLLAGGESVVLAPKDRSNAEAIAIGDARGCPSHGGSARPYQLVQSPGDGGFVQTEVGGQVGRPSVGGGVDLGEQGLSHDGQREVKIDAEITGAAN
jgi:hypothetical protein